MRCSRASTRRNAILFTYFSLKTKNAHNLQYTFFYKTKSFQNVEKTGYCREYSEKLGGDVDVSQGFANSLILHKLPQVQNERYP